MWRLREFANFLRAPLGGKLLVVEAAWQLVRARIDTARPASHYTPLLGREGHEAASPGEGQEALAERIGAVVARTALWMPFRSECLQQVLALRRMLDRRGVPATVCLGVETGEPDPAKGRRAHAWVRTGNRIVNGNLELDRYAVVGEYS